jgi:hypothetical protein
MDFASSYVYVAEEADDDVEMFDEAQLDNVSIKKQAKPRRKRDSDSDEADLPINEAKPSEPKKSKAEKPKDKKEKKVGFFGSIFGRSRKDAEEPAAAAPAPARELASDDDEDDDINDMEEQLQQVRSFFFEGCEELQIGSPIAFVGEDQKPLKIRAVGWRKVENPIPMLFNSVLQVIVAI